MTTTDEIYQRTTAAIIARIEAGAGSWSMPWTAGIDFPTNPTTTKRYRGMNVVILWSAALEAEYPTGEWATYRQWRDAGAQVRKGEHGTRCLFWAKDQTRERTDPTTGETVTVHIERDRPIARVFTVFNAAQVDGYAPRVAQLDTTDATDHAAAWFARIGARVEHHAGGAYYSPAEDLIRLPHLERFTTPGAYWATSAHEHAHWTGHPDRLARNLTSRFDRDAYAMEELVAELSAAFTCARLHLSPTPRPDHAAYLASWLDVLKADPKALLTVASKAQHATDHLADLAGTVTAPLHDGTAA